MAENLLDIVKIDTGTFVCEGFTGDCTWKERTLSYALFVEVPDQPETPEEVFKECCYVHKVLASTTDTDLFKNDFSGFFHKRQTPSETCDFILIDLSDASEYTLNDDTYGKFKGFGSIQTNPDLTWFKLEWRKVLIDLGVGAYKVVKRINLAGIDVEIEYFVYNLFEYSSTIANGTARMDITMSGLLEAISIDFSDTGFCTSIRVPGFFGNREHGWEEDILVNRNYVRRQISMKQTNEYKFQANLIPYCITKEIVDFMLFSDDIRFFDYNLNNHSYDFKNFPVKLANNDGTRYPVTSRKADLNITFSDKKINNNKRNY